MKSFAYRNSLNIIGELRSSQHKTRPERLDLAPTFCLMWWHEMNGGIGASFIALYIRLYVNSRNVHPFLSAPSSSIPTYVGLSVSWLVGNWPALAGPRCPFVSSSSYLPIIYQNIQISTDSVIQISTDQILNYYTTWWEMCCPMSIYVKLSGTIKLLKSGS